MLRSMVGGDRGGGRDIWGRDGGRLGGGCMKGQGKSGGVRRGGGGGVVREEGMGKQKGRVGGGIGVGEVVGG